MISTAVPQDFGKVIHIFSDMGTNTPRLLHDLNLIRPNRLLPPLKVCHPHQRSLAEYTYGES